MDPFEHRDFMLSEYKVSRCTRRCFTQDRPLRDGEWYYSVVIEKDESFERRDYGAESWKEPPADAIGWWKSRMPTAGQKKLVLAPPEVLVDVLRQMARVPGQAKSRYLLALMLLRRKVIREIKPGNDQDAASCLRVQVAADDTTIEVPVVTIARSEVETLTNALNDLLYCEADAEA